MRGIISTNDKSGLDARSASVLLIGLDGGLFLFTHTQAIDFQGSFPLPKVEYFDIEKCPSRPIHSVCFCPWAGLVHEEGGSERHNAHEIYFSSVGTHKLNRRYLCDALCLINVKTVALEAGDLLSRTLTVGETKTEGGSGRVVPLNFVAHAAMVRWAGRFPRTCATAATQGSQKVRRASKR
jgi:hypothetical protein